MQLSQYQILLPLTKQNMGSRIIQKLLNRAK